MLDGRFHGQGRRAPLPRAPRRSPPAAASQELDRSTLLLLGLPALGLTLAVTATSTYLAPSWALFPALVPPEQAGRAGSAEGSWRLAASALALIGGGLLYDVAACPSS